MLATTFNTLTDSIARFQREAAQRERLSSLGRLSTVIAHEVRNPLMIIKGALRTLVARRRQRGRRARRREGHRRGDRAAEQPRQRRARLRAADPVRSRAHRHQRGVPRRRAGGRRRPATTGAGARSIWRRRCPTGHRQRAAAHRAGQPADQRRITRSKAPPGTPASRRG